MKSIVKRTVMSASVSVALFGFYSNAYADTNIDDISPETPLVIQKGQFADVIYDSATDIQQLQITLETAEPYDNVSIYLIDDGSAGEESLPILVDNIDVPSSGSSTLESTVTFDGSSDATLRIAAKNGELVVSSMVFSDVSAVTVPEFTDISEQIGLPDDITYKYGGPSVGDVDNDGDYDFVLNNHNYITPQMVINNGASVTEIDLYQGARDYHGTTLGDYDNDGDLDVIVGMGGANGTNPSSYNLLRNDDGEYVLLTEAESGIDKASRGRSPRFVDFNQDGLLDLVMINALTELDDYDLPQQHFYQNLGSEQNYKFEYVSMPNIEDTPSERVLVLDYNNDNIDDLLLLSPPSLWQGTGSGFVERSELLPDEIRAYGDIQAATNVDVNRDGKQDLYLVRGLPEYQLANKSADFDANGKTLDIRDSGETGTTAIEFESEGAITLSDLNLTYRQYDEGYPLYIGANATKTWMYATGFQETQELPEMANAPDTLSFTQQEAAGFPDVRENNGIYIGYVDGQWQMEWVRTQNVYWNVSFSVDNVENLIYKGWEPQNRNRQDILLIAQEDDSFVDSSTEWHIPQGGNHWGVTNGDFNNDGHMDLFIHRFGYLKERVMDLLLLNDGTRFYTTTMHGAHDPLDEGHGDMGQAFDFDGDGNVDLLNGSNEVGKWYLYKNTSTEHGNYIQVDVGYSPEENIDPLGALLVIETNEGEQLTQRVGSAGEVFSQGLMNLVHIGVGEAQGVAKITVIWRNGETFVLNQPTIGKYSTDATAI